jgi:hypothetical protein
MKTPEELAEEYCKEAPAESDCWWEGAYGGFLAGYQAGRSNSEAVQAAAPQWISVRDRLPEEDQEVLIYDWPFRFTCLFWKSRESAFQWELSNGRNCNPTHWMPLPAAPKEEA